MRTEKAGSGGPRDNKQAGLDPAGEKLHDILLDPLELNSVETEVTAAMVFKKMLDSTQPGDKGEYEECIDATVLARDVLLRTHGFSPCQHVFGRDLELSFDVLVLGADVAAVTMSVLDRPSERAVQIRQAARKAFVESQDDKAMGRALERVQNWRSSCVLAKGQRSGNAFWTRSLAWQCNCAGSVSWFEECVDRVQASSAQGVARTVCGWQQSLRGLQMT